MRDRERPGPSENQAMLFPGKLSSPPRTFSLLNTQDGCTLNNKREGVNHEITHVSIYQISG